MISVTTKSTSTPDGAAKLVAQITQLVDSYMIWIGSAEPSSDDQAAIQGGRLCTDWACAMAGSKCRWEPWARAFPGAAAAPTSRWRCRRESVSSGKPSCTDWTSGVPLCRRVSRTSIGGREMDHRMLKGLGIA
ncbi:hypothetical protein BDZ89DRAFT_1057666 [Hymenopellis radicata]|nr:hypothetical protein BDZ89DRAFT_1057666 [Hymenopellis radicata]